MSMISGALRESSESQARGVGDIGDQPVQPGNVLRDDGEQARGAGGVFDAGQGLDGRADRGERVFDLVADIGGELLDRVHARPEGFGRAVQRAGQGADFIVAVGDLLRQRLGARTALAHQRGGIGEAQDRRGDGAGKVEGDDDRERQSEREEAENGEPDGQDGGIHLVGLAGEEHGADILLGALDGLCHRDEELALRVAPHEGGGFLVGGALVSCRASRASGCQPSVSGSSPAPEPTRPDSSSLPTTEPERWS